MILDPWSPPANQLAPPKTNSSPSSLSPQTVFSLSPIVLFTLPKTHLQAASRPFCLFLNFDVFLSLFLLLPALPFSVFFFLPRWNKSKPKQPYFFFGQNAAKSCVLASPNFTPKTTQRHAFWAIWVWALFAFFFGLFILVWAYVVGSEWGLGFVIIVMVSTPCVNCMNAEF